MSIIVGYGGSMGTFVYSCVRVTVRRPYDRTPIRSRIQEIDVAGDPFETLVSKVWNLATESIFFQVIWILESKIAT